MVFGRLQRHVEGAGRIETEQFANCTFQNKNTLPLFPGRALHQYGNESGGQRAGEACRGALQIVQTYKAHAAGQALSILL